MSENSSHSHRKRLNESLSAVIDGEAGEFEFRFVLDRISYDDELHDKAFRYQLEGEAIRHEINRFSDVDLSARIRDQLDCEDGASSDATRLKRREHPQAEPDNAFYLGRRLWGQFGRVALAVSVAVTLVIGIRNYNMSSEIEYFADSGAVETSLSQPVQVARNGYGALSIQAGYGSRQHSTVSVEQLNEAKSVVSRVARERFKAYAVHHTQMNSVYSGQMLPFARLTTLESE